MTNRRIIAGVTIAVAVILSLVLGLADSQADTVILNRGSALEGAITEENNNSITIQTGTSSFRISKNDIKEIIRFDVSSDEERAGDRLAREGDWRGALANYEQAYQTNPEDRLLEKLETARAKVRDIEKQESEAMLKEVRSAQAAGNHDAAVKRLKSLITNTSEGPLQNRLLSELAVAHHLHSQKLIDAVRYEQARSELEAAIKANPQYRLAYLDLAELLRTEPGKQKEAADLFAKGFSLSSPSLPSKQECKYRFHWAELLYRSGEYEKALANFNEVMAECPRDYPNLMTYVVDVNIKLGEKMKGRDVEESIRALKAAITQNPSALDARFLLAQIYYDNRQNDQAISTLRSLLEFEPRYPKANYLLAQAYREKGDLENYRLQLEREIAVNPAGYDSYCELGEHLLEGAENEKALYYFDRAIKVNDGPGRAHYGRATALRKLKRLDEAEAEARTIAEKDATNPEGLTTLGQVLSDQNKLQEADETLLRALAIFAERSDKLSDREKKLQADTYFNLGEVALKNKSSNKAYENFQKAVDLNPRNSAAYHGMATALVDARRLPEAEDAYIRAIEQKPDEAEYYLGLGILYHTHYSRPSEALPFYLKYLELGGEDRANVERWIEQCGGKVGDKATIDIASLAEKVRKRRERESLTADSTSTGTLTRTIEGLTTGTLAVQPPASFPATTQAASATMPTQPAP